MSSPSKRIPRFASIQEEAEFWDSHDFTEYSDGFEPVELQVDDDFKSVYIMQVEGALVADLLTAADAEGLRPGELARELIADGLKRGRRQRHAS